MNPLVIPLVINTSQPQQAMGALVQLASEGAQIMTEGFEQAAKHVQDVAQEFLKLQETLRIIATYKGEKLTDESTVKSAQAGAAAGLTPQQWRDFEEQFYGFSGQFIGDDVDAQGDRTRKFTKEQGAEMEKRAAAFMNAKGIKAAEGGAVFGELLQQAGPGASVDDIMMKFGQVYSILEQAKGNPGQLMAQMGSVTAQGLDAVSAAKLLRVQAQASPGRAGTHARSLAKGFTTMKPEVAAEMGIKAGMDIFQKVSAVEATLKRRGLKQGSDEEAKFLRRGFNDIQEFDAIMAELNFGKRGGLERAADLDAAKYKPGGDIDVVNEFKEGKPGSRIFHEAEAQAAKIEEGARFADVEDIKKQAHTQLEREHAFTEPTMLGVLGRGILSGTTGVSSEQQMTNEKAIELASQQAGESSKYLTTAGMGQSEVNQEIKRLLEIANQQRERQANKPLVAQPPAAGGARP